MILFSEIPHLAIFFLHMPICPYAHMPIFGHMGIWAYGHMQKNMAKWGIPEKRIKNAAQRCYSEVPRTLQSKVIAKNRFVHILSSFLECKKGIFFRAKYTHKLMIKFFSKIPSEMEVAPLEIELFSRFNYKILKCIQVF